MESIHGQHLEGPLMQQSEEIEAQVDSDFFFKNSMIASGAVIIYSFMRPTYPRTRFQNRCPADTSTKKIM
jgi:hypothetical protein